MKNEKSRGFTLIELLIVVVVIATLLGLVFRLAGVGDEQSRRNTTIARLQKLEFALSGYFSAFGSYPPVPLHGTRDIFADVNDHGVQKSSGGTSESNLNWVRVRAACLSQPVACEFPYNGKDKNEVASAKLRADYYNESGGDWTRFSKFDILENDGSGNRFNKNGKSSSWQDIQVFKFGVMSFLLPRYLFMIAGPKELYDSDSYNAQWKSQNDLATIFNFRNGKRLYDKWEKLHDHTYQRTSRELKTTDYDNEEYRRIMMQPSQAVCARWIQALEGIVTGGRTFYGVNTETRDEEGYQHYRDGPQPNRWMLSGIYAPGDSRNDSYNNQYMLDGMTVRDGWGMDLFYYSPPPYQGYRLWSAGPNGKTIPPWIDTSSLDANNRKTAADWMSDDIVGLSAPAN